MADLQSDVAFIVNTGPRPRCVALGTIAIEGGPGDQRGGGGASERRIMSRRVRAQLPWSGVIFVTPRRSSLTEPSYGSTGSSVDTAGMTVPPLPIPDKCSTGGRHPFSSLRVYLLYLHAGAHMRGGPAARWMQN